ncbi:MAG: monovalent cation/H(+) antiporter subunit G [Pseudomonadota bacterium]
MSEILTQAGEIFHAVRPFLGGALAVLGGVLTVIGSVGLLRFPDFYTRLHAASVIDTSATTFLIIGLALLSPSWLIAFKLAVIWLFLFLTSPTASHAIASAAHTAGLQPLIGRAARGGDDGAPTS